MSIFFSNIFSKGSHSFNANRRIKQKDLQNKLSFLWMKKMRSKDAKLYFQDHKIGYRQHWMRFCFPLITIKMNNFQ